MAKAKVKVEKFDRINRNALKMRRSSSRTRTGALNTPNRQKAHGKHYK